MSDIGPISHHQASIGSVHARRAGSQDAGRAQAPQRTADRVELSTTAKLLGQLADVPEVREDLIARAKANIQAGVYDANAIIDATVDRLSEDL